MTDDFGSAADTAIEHAGADAAVGLAQTKGPPASPNCLNCGTLLSGEFCHHCGQSGQSLRRPFWTLVSESLETFFSLDGRIAHTLPNLMLRPGRMTRDYLDGQRARFIPPFRLYVFASLIFFVLLPLMTGQGFGFGPRASGNLEDARAQVERAFAEGNMSEEEYREAIEGLDQLDALWKGGIPGLVSSPPPEPGADAAENETGPGSPDREWVGFMPKEALDSVREAGERGDRDAAQFAEVMDDPARLARQTQEWIPRLMFVLLPVYALLLAAVYIWRRQFLFFDHLIVSLHFHSALFFAMSVGFLVSLLIGSGWVVLALLIWSNWYLYRMLRTVYGTGRTTAVLRVLTLDSIYFCVLLSGILTAVILGALSL
ncbi:DUF3667 domain-containing protein [Hyphomonas sp.]|uniref:DUF3667 domain-containing protein n=1 Tax=Hyphomonas sp. TaxID=87 RepID=UPI00391876A9